MGILKQIDHPRQVKTFDRSRLPRLAGEIRNTILDVVSRNGGHLASSLGAVELAIALHYVFDSPKDKIVWDVGHQAYAHKLLTGRYRRFHTIRAYEGLCGFPKRSESPHDVFSTGHSSTGISAGLGMICGKRLKTGDGKNRFRAIRRFSAAPWSIWPKPTAA